MTTVVEAQVEPERLDSGGDVRIPMAGLFGFLPKPAAAAADAELPEVSAPTPDHYQLTSEGLPAGWAMQLMRNGRTLFIDNANQSTTWVDPRTGKPAPSKESGSGRSAGSFVFPTFESPPSPLSLMDVITVGSPVAVDRSVRSTGTSSSSAATTVMSPPPPLARNRRLGDAEEAAERLLPIGNNTIARCGLVQYATPARGIMSFSLYPGCFILKIT